MIVLTGAAGFIGFHVAKMLLSQGHHIIGIDNMNDYYDVSLKKGRLAQLAQNDQFHFYQADISDAAAITDIFKRHGNDITEIVHLAAQAGVRYSLENPMAYSASNLTGQVVMLEAARHAKQLKHFVYASSSSVYGGNTKQPFSVDDPVTNPVSLYAATKRAGELLTQSYANLYDIPSTGLRFFTVYGPWGRPDMAYFSFTRDILDGNPITIFNKGEMKRDLTWIDDCVRGIIGALYKPPGGGDDKYCLHGTPHRIFNLGNNKPEKLMDFVDVIEQAVGIKANKKLMDVMAPGDVAETYADIDPAVDVLGYHPKTPISEGIPQFVEWYKHYRKI